MKPSPTQRTVASRALLPLSAATALALPILWFVADGSADGSGRRAESPITPVAGPPVVEPVEEAPELLRGPLPAGATASRRASRRPAAVAPSGAGSRPLPGNGLEADALGVLLRGRLRCAGVDGGGAVLIGAVGPAGQRLDEIGVLGEDYALHGLVPGDWQLVLRGPSIVEHRRALTVPEDADELALDLTVEPAPVVEVLFLTSWGERLESALRSGGRDPAGMPRLEVLGAEIESPVPELVPTTGAGRFRLAGIDGVDGLPPVSGWIELTTPPPFEVRLVQAGAELERRRVESVDDPLLFVVDPLEESGRPSLTGLLVEAETGEPIDDAIVELFAAGGDAPVRTRRIGADGRLRMAGIGAGDWVLSVWSAGHAHLVRPLSIEGEPDYVLGPIELSAARLVDGRLLGPDGRPLPNRPLRWSEGDGLGPAAMGYGREAVRTDAGGMFAIGGVPDGPLTLIAGGDEYAAEAFRLEIDGDRARELELRLRPGTPVALAVDGETDGRLELTVRDAEGRVVFLRQAAAGRAVRAVLAPGDYRAELLDGGRAVASTIFGVADDPVGVALRAE